jgi:hypothetical protein
VLRIFLVPIIAMSVTVPHTAIKATVPQESTAWAAGDAAILKQVVDYANAVKKARAQEKLAERRPTPTTSVIVNTDSPTSTDAFLACTRAHESDRAGGYGAISPGGTYRGAYQFDQTTWNGAATMAGRPDLIGVDPATASSADQDLLATALHNARGNQPWGGRC